MEFAMMDEDSMEKMSFLWILHSWLLQCTAHGIPKVISYTNFHRKIFWLVAVVVCSLAFLYQITDMMIDVYTYPVTVNLQITHRDQLDFPTVTMCNSNKIKESLLRNYHRNDSDLMKMVTFEDFNSIGLKDIYDELVESRAAETLISNSISRSNKARNSTVPTPAATPPGMSDPVPRCPFGDPPQNGFKCLADDDRCIPDYYVCDNYNDCSDAADEDPKYCGSKNCEPTDYACQNGACISPHLRCDGKFDCVDGSDEAGEYCGPNTNEKGFICCTHNRKISEEQMCDGFIDCTRDLSDEFGPACPSGGSSNKTSSNKTVCHHPTFQQYRSLFSGDQLINITNNQLYDGKVDCFKGVDENCVWKKEVSLWASPRDTDDFRNYEKVLGNQVEMRWYIMATMEEMSLLGHKYDEMIIKCSADNKDCDQSITVNYTVSQDYGNCFSFTYKKPVTTSGKNYGLQIWYNLEAYDSLGLFTATSGLKLFLTTPGLVDRNGNVFVDLTSELSLPPGFEHMVSVQPNNVQKLVEPYSTCENYGEGTVHIYNTRDDCLRHCVNLLKAQICGCVDDLLFRKVPLCTLNQTYERECVDYINAFANPNTVCDCPNECNVKSYDVTITQLEWPTNRSIARFVASVYKDLNGSAIDYLMTAIDKYTVDKTENSQTALTQLRSTFGSVTVYFRDLSEMIIIERPVYNFIMVVSNFGGLLGLYLGISVLTVLELVDFIFDFMEYMKLRGKKQSGQKVANLRSGTDNFALISESAENRIWPVKTFHVEEENSSKGTLDIKNHLSNLPPLMTR